MSQPDVPMKVKKVIKLKKPAVLVEQPVVEEPVVEEPVIEAPAVKPSVRKVIKLKKPIVVEPVLEAPVIQQKKPKIKIRQGLPIPPVPTGALSVTMEAFEALREYYLEREEPIPQSDLKWYYDAMEEEKKDYDTFWKEIPDVKAQIDAAWRGDSDETLDKIQADILKTNPKKPDTDLGPMPTFKSPEFWVWCRKRKAIKEQQEAAIIAAGGTVPPPKVKKPRKPKD